MRFAERQCVARTASHAEQFPCSFADYWLVDRASGPSLLSEEVLPADIVHQLASILTLDDGAFIIGGQALNIWAEHFQSVSELAYFGPYTSKDIDYFGQRDAAEKLADAIGGKVLVPAFGDNTPESAVVTATIDGHEIKIDFLTHVLGVEDQGLKNTAITMNLTVQTPGGPALLKVPIMHPVQCMQSRIANVTNLKRDSELSKRQLEASPIIVREFISEMLSVGHGKEATRCLSQIFEYLRSDIDGKRAHKIMTNDPAAILDHFQDDERIDERYRAKTLHNMREQLRSRRTAWGRIKAVLAMKSEIAVPELEPGSH